MYLLIKENGWPFKRKFLLLERNASRIRFKFLRRFLSVRDT